MPTQPKKKTPVPSKKSAGLRKPSNAGKSRKRVVPPPTSAKVKPASTKKDAAIALLRAPGGITIDGLMKATGWQQHSVRGFLAGVVRKRLKLTLASSLVDGHRVYRVTGAQRAELLKS
jgi:hypothetical protein